MQNVYFFGNQDENCDNLVFDVVNNISKKLPGIKFIEIKPNQDLPFNNKENIILMDAVEGVNVPQLFDENDFEKIILPPRVTAHDFDLGFQLKYLKKIGKLGKVCLIALPKDKKFDYSLVISIFKKLVAQDIQGS